MTRTAAGLPSELSGAITFGIDSDAAFRAIAVETDISGSRFTVATPEGG